MPNPAELMSVSVSFCSMKRRGLFPPPSPLSRMTRYFESNNNLRDRGQDFPKIQSPNVMLSWCLTKRLFAEAKDDITFIPYRVNKLT